MLYCEINEQQASLRDLDSINEVATATLKYFPYHMLAKVTPLTPVSVEDAEIWLHLFTQKLQPLAKKHRIGVKFESDDPNIKTAISLL